MDSKQYDSKQFHVIFDCIFVQNTIQNRSSRQDVFYKKYVLKNLAKFTGKHLCQSLF